MKKTEANMFREFLRLLDIYLNSKMDEATEKTILALANFELEAYLKLREDREKYKFHSKYKEDLVKWFKVFYKKPTDQISKALIIDNRKHLAEKQQKRNQALKASAVRKISKNYMRAYGSA